MTKEGNAAQLTAWLAEQLPDATDVRVEGLERIEFGHSAEMLVLTIGWQAGGQEHRQDVVIRLRPPSPGLLEPYDMKRQFDILRALETTDVKAPRALWIDESGEVLGRPFYVMERVAGEVYERTLPEHLKGHPERIAKMSEAVFDQIAAMHLVDLQATGLDALGGGEDYLDRELDRWEDEVRKWQRGPLPALEKLVETLRRQQPKRSPIVTLVHGDPKPGNFAFAGDEVSAIFDWELASIGDPLADLGWAEMTWQITPAFAGLDAAHFDEQLVRYQQRTGITVHHRGWYAALQAYKMAVIQFVGAMLFDQGYSNDKRYADMALFIPWLTDRALARLGVTEKLDSGPVEARKERLLAWAAAQPPKPQ